MKEEEGCSCLSWTAGLVRPFSSRLALAFMYCTEIMPTRMLRFLSCGQVDKFYLWYHLRKMEKQHRAAHKMQCSMGTTEGTDTQETDLPMPYIPPTTTSATTPTDARLVPTFLGVVDTRVNTQLPLEPWMASHYTAISNPLMYTGAAPVRHAVEWDHNTRSSILPHP